MTRAAAQSKAKSDTDKAGKAGKVSKSPETATKSGAGKTKQGKKPAPTEANDTTATRGKDKAKSGQRKQRASKPEPTLQAQAMQPASGYQQRLGRLLRGAVLFAAVAITAFLLASLVTYAPGDPGWSGIGNGPPVENMFGLPGAWFADVLLSLFGWFGFIFPWMVLYGGWLVFASIRHGHASVLSKSIRAVSSLLWLLSGCALAWLVLGQTPAMPQGGGGVIGMAIGGHLAAIVNPMGAFWLLLTVFAISLSMGLGFSWVALTERVGNMVLAVLTGGVSGLRNRHQARRQARADKAAQLPQQTPRP